MKTLGFVLWMIITSLVVSAQNDDYYQPGKDRFNESPKKPAGTDTSSTFINGKPRSADSQGINQVTTHPSQPGQDVVTMDCKESHQKGVMEAKKEKQWLWFGGAAAGNCVSGCGGCIVPVVAAMNENYPPEYPAGVDKECYLKGYGKEMKKQKILMSSAGAAVSIAIMFGGYIGLIILDGGI